MYSHYEQDSFSLTSAALFSLYVQAFVIVGEASRSGPPVALSMLASPTTFLNMPVFLHFFLHLSKYPCLCIHALLYPALWLSTSLSIYLSIYELSCISLVQGPLQFISVLHSNSRCTSPRAQISPSSLFHLTFFYSAEITCTSMNSFVQWSFHHQ